MKIAIAILVLFCVPALWQTIQTERDRRRYAAPGTLTTVDGRRIHVLCSGTGGPTVVISGGTGVWSSQWSVIQRQLAGRVRVCTWDRPGFGWSDPGPAVYTASDAADDLRAALHAIGERSPYVLVGESYGGYIVRLFHDRHPGEVAGVVLIESAHERQFDDIPQAQALLNRARIQLRVALWLSRLGVLRFMTLDSGNDLPSDVRPAFQAMQTRPQTIRAMLTEIAGVPETTRQLTTTRGLGEIPEVVLSAGRSFNRFTSETREPALPLMNARWLSLQAGLARLSSKSVHLISPDATHAIARDDPGRVIDAIVRGVGLAIRR